jgi:predicted RNA-binding Zn ribbon-like protein
MQSTDAGTSASFLNPVSYQLLMNADEPRSIRRPFRQTGLVSVDLANTWDPYLADPERLPDERALGAFLREQRIARRPGRGDLAACRLLRDQLWRVVDASSPDELVERLDALARGLTVTPRIERHADGWRLTVEPRPDVPVAELLAARAVAELAQAVADQGPERIRLCAASPCREVFVDTSRNATRRYCCRRCANRVSAAHHRERHAKRAPSVRTSRAGDA